MTAGKLETKEQLEIDKLKHEIENLKKANRWNVLTQSIPVVTALIAVGGFLFGIIQYNAQQQRDADLRSTQQQTDKDLREKEFKRRFWEKQLEVFSNISNSAARIATLEDSAEREKEYQRFRELYYGNLLMVADKDVASAAKACLQRIIDYRNDPTKKIDVQVSSKQLANACRNSLSHSWNLPLEALDVSQH